MSITFRNIIGAIRKSGACGSLLTSLNNEVRKYNKSFHYIDLDHVYLYIWKNEVKNNFYLAVHAKCSDDYNRTGFSDGDTPRIYKSTEFETFDGVFCFMTEQVEQTIKEFNSTRFLFYPEIETSLYNTASIHEYDNSTQTWIPYSIYIYKCSKCNFEIPIDKSSKLLDFGSDFLCTKCGSDGMCFSRYKFKEHNQEIR